MSEHTPTPWSWDTSPRGMYLYAVGRGLGVADIRGGLTSTDADLIVRACNSHDDLLAALEGQLAWHIEFRHTGHECEPCCQIAQAREAIAEAKGE